MRLLFFCTALIFLPLSSLARPSLPDYDLDWFNQCAHFQGHDKKTSNSVTFCRNKEPRTGEVNCSLYADLPQLSKSIGKAEVKAKIVVNGKRIEHKLRSNGFLFFASPPCLTDGRLELELSFEAGNQVEDNQGAGFRLTFPALPD